MHQLLAQVVDGGYILALMQQQCTMMLADMTADMAEEGDKMRSLRPRGQHVTNLLPCPNLDGREMLLVGLQGRDQFYPYGHSVDWQ